jgi:hypothetical protein
LRVVKGLSCDQSLENSRPPGINILSKTLFVYSSSHETLQDFSFKFLLSKTTYVRKFGKIQFSLDDRILANVV